MGFKAGDKVITVNADQWRDNYTDKDIAYPWVNGTKGEVLSTADAGYYVEVRAEDGTVRSGIMASRFALIEEAKVRQFKTGDRIRVKDGSRFNDKAEANVVDALSDGDYFDFNGTEKVWADWWEGQPTYISADRVEKVEALAEWEKELLASVDPFEEDDEPEDEDTDDDFPFKVGDTVTATINCMGIKEGEDYVIQSIDSYKEYLTVLLPSGDTDQHPTGEFKVKEPEAARTLHTGDRVYVARVPGVERYGAGWVTVESEPDNEWNERLIFNGKYEADGSTWLFSAIDDVIEPPVVEPEVERADHTALVEKADALIGALTITQEQQYALSVLRDLRDALVQESYR